MHLATDVGGVRGSGVEGEEEFREEFRGFCAGGGGDEVLGFL